MGARAHFRGRRNVRAGLQGSRRSHRRARPHRPQLGLCLHRPPLGPRDVAPAQGRGRARAFPGEAPRRRRLGAHRRPRGVRGHVGLHALRQGRARHDRCVQSSGAALRRRPGAAHAPHPQQAQDVRVRAAHLGLQRVRCVLG
eukprot:Amastigsp_a4_175.p4 type:complete len:142 gc:universal Amastigsp_a4_175:492-917(+)